jgi:hypothetical protein
VNRPRSAPSATCRAHPSVYSCSSTRQDARRPLARLSGARGRSGRLRGVQSSLERFEALVGTIQERVEPQEDTALGGDTLDRRERH